jgi:hypothetical protein
MPWLDSGEPARNQPHKRIQRVTHLARSDQAVIITADDALSLSRHAEAPMQR